MAKLWCLALILALFVATQAKAPCGCGTVLRVKKVAMEYACQTQRRPLQEALQLLHIPGFSGTVKTAGGLFDTGLLGGLFGGLKKLTDTVLNIAGIDIKKVQLPEMKVNLKPGRGIQVLIDTGLDIKLRAILLDGIEFKVAAGVTADIEISRTSKGRPILTISACKSIIGDLEFTVGGKQLIPDVVKLLRNNIHAFLADKMCLTVSGIFLRLNPHLEMFGASAQINAQVGLEYTMPNPPVITDQYMDMNMNVDYQMKGQTMDHLSVISKDLQLPSDAGQKDAMVNMGLSAEYFNNLFLALRETGGFNMDISSESVSAQDAYRLSTTSLGLIISNINSMYPHPQPIKLIITLSRAPLVTLKPGKIALSLTPSLEIVTAMPGYPTNPLLLLDVDLLLAVQIGVSGGKLSVSLAMDSELQVAVVSSSVGPCKVSSLAEYITTYFRNIFMVKINKVLSVGVSLPSLPDVELIKPVTDVQQEYAVVSCDLKYRE